MMSSCMSTCLHACDMKCLGRGGKFIDQAAKILALCMLCWGQAHPMAQHCHSADLLSCARLLSCPRFIAGRLSERGSMHARSKYQCPFCEDERMTFAIRHECMHAPPASCKASDDKRTHCSAYQMALTMHKQTAVSEDVGLCTSSACTPSFSSSC